MKRWFSLLLWNMDEANLKPFFARITQICDSVFMSGWQTIDTVYLAKLTDKDNKAASFQKTFVVEDKQLTRTQDVVFDSYFLPSPLTYEIVDNMQGLLFFIKDKDSISFNNKSVFMPMGVLGEAFLQGKNENFGLRKTFLAIVESLLDLAQKINSGTPIGRGSGSSATGGPVTTTVISTIDLSDTIQKLTQLQMNLGE